MDDLTGRVFGKWTVLHYSGKNERKQHSWMCECECGTVRSVEGQRLIRGTSTCCGCENAKIGVKPREKRNHGESQTRLYVIWLSMRSRCYTKTNDRYEDYGGRGIDVCDEWKYDYLSFKEWSYKTGYDENAPYGKCTLDRIDNEKGYSPDNCRWVDLFVQGKNKRNNVNVTIDGETKTAKEWSDFFGIPYSTVRSRKHKGWPESLWFIPQIRESWRSHGR